jgi:hypothetical protein
MRRRCANSLSPDYIASQQVTREKVGDIEVAYAGTAALGVDSVRPVVTVVDEMLAGLLRQPIPGILVV